MLFSQSSYSFQFYWKKFLQKLTPESCTSISRFLSFSQSFKSNKYKQKCSSPASFHPVFFPCRTCCAPVKAQSPFGNLHVASLFSSAHKHTLKPLFIFYFFYSRKMICKLSPSPLKTGYVSCYFLKKIQWASKLCAEVFGFPP